jgi:hypothetical protein
MVDRKDAHFLKAGSLRIGTMAGYSTIENGREDPLDGAIEARIGHLAVTAETAREKFGRFRLGEVRGTGKAVFNSCTIEERSPPWWIFCMTHVGNTFDPKPHVPKAVFEIADVEKLAQHICAAYPEKVAAGGIWHVRYGTRSMSLQDAQKAFPSPDIKDFRFWPEWEARMAFQPTDPDACRDYFDTGPDPVIARMLKPVL